MTQNTTKNDKREQCDTKHNALKIYLTRKIYSVSYPVPPAQAPASAYVNTVLKQVYYQSTWVSMMPAAAWRQCGGSGSVSGGGGSAKHGGGAQRGSGSAVAAARRLRRWLQRDSATSAAARRRHASHDKTPTEHFFTVEQVKQNEYKHQLSSKIPCVETIPESTLGLNNPELQKSTNQY